MAENEETIDVSQPEESAPASSGESSGGGSSSSSSSSSSASSSGHAQESTPAPAAETPASNPASASAPASEPASSSDSGSSSENSDSGSSSSSAETSEAAPEEAAPTAETPASTPAPATTETPSTEEEPAATETETPSAEETPATETETPSTEEEPELDVGGGESAETPAPTEETPAPTDSGETPAPAESPREIAARRRREREQQSQGTEAGPSDTDQKTEDALRETELDSNVTETTPEEEVPVPDEETPSQQQQQQQQQEQSQSQEQNTNVDVDVNVNIEQPAPQAVEPTTAGITVQNPDGTTTSIQASTGNGGVNQQLIQNFINTTYVVTVNNYPRIEEPIPEDPEPTDSEPDPEQPTNPDPTPVVSPEPAPNPNPTPSTPASTPDTPPADPEEPEIPVSEPAPQENPNLGEVHDFFQNCMDILAYKFHFPVDKLAEFCGMTEKLQAAGYRIPGIDDDRGLDAAERESYEYVERTQERENALAATEAYHGEQFPNFDATDGNLGFTAEEYSGKVSEIIDRQAAIESGEASPEDQLAQEEYMANHNYSLVYSDEQWEGLTDEQRATVQNTEAGIATHYALDDYLQNQDDSKIDERLNVIEQLKVGAETTPATIQAIASSGVDLPDNVDSWAAERAAYYQQVAEANPQPDSATYAWDVDATNLNQENAPDVDSQGTAADRARTAETFLGTNDIEASGLMEQTLDASDAANL